MFGFGVIVSVVVGMVILYQTLATQIIRHLPQYATFKAIGYTDGFLQRVVLSLALITAGVAFVPALATALMAYDRLRTLAGCDGDDVRPHRRGARHRAHHVGGNSAAGRQQGSPGRSGGPVLGEEADIMIWHRGFAALRVLGARVLRLSPVPLAWRNLLSDRRRLARSSAGVGFAALLMMVELGFRNGYIESMLLVMRRLDGDIMLVSSQKYQFERIAPFSRRQLYEAAGVRGVASARPLYMERTASIWRNPQNGRHFAVLTFAFDPDQPVLLIPEVQAMLPELRQQDTIAMIAARAAFSATSRPRPMANFRAITSRWPGPSGSARTSSTTETSS